MKPRRTVSGVVPSRLQSAINSAGSSRVRVCFTHDSRPDRLPLSQPRGLGELFTADQIFTRMLSHSELRELIFQDLAPIWVRATRTDISRPGPYMGVAPIWVRYLKTWPLYGWAYAPCEVGLGGLHQKMVVVGHLALGVDQPVELRAHLAEHAIENLAVGFVQVDVLVPVTP